jgi:hypothetical protein
MITQYHKEFNTNVYVISKLGIVVTKIPLSCTKSKSQSTSMRVPTSSTVLRKHLDTSKYKFLEILDI